MSPLASMYQHGYRMLMFSSLPGQTKARGKGRSQVRAKFHGIFRKPFPEELGQQWEVKVEKTVLLTQMFHEWTGNLLPYTSSNSGSTSDTTHIVRTIDRVNEMSGRLVSVEMTGMAGQEMQMKTQTALRQAHVQNWRTGTIPKMQTSVDVFYEIPRHGTSEKYTYQIVSCPIESTFHRKFTQVQFHSGINWQAVLTQYLDCGWKLAEIFCDQSSSAVTQETTFGKDVQSRRNCMFIFEKPRSRLNDNTPFYEGTMVEHYFKTRIVLHWFGIAGVDVNVTTDCEPLIDHMGEYGWQVVRILDTLDTVVRSRHEVDTRQLIFFQRKRAGSIESSSLQQGAHPPPRVDARFFF